MNLPRRLAPLVWLGFCAPAFAAEPAAEAVRAPAKPAVRPRHDAPDQLFRRAPTAESSRTIAIPLATNLHIAFDAHLLRVHTAWSGPNLSLLGPPYTGSKTPFLCHHEGKTLWTMPPFCPWASGETALTNYARPAADARFKGMSTMGDSVTLEYEIAAGEAKPVRVRESYRAQPAGEFMAAVRRFQIPACAKELRFLAHAEMGKAIARVGETSAVMIARESDWLLAVAHSEASVEWTTIEADVSYPIELNEEKTGDSFTRTNIVTGRQARAWLRVPPHDHELAVEIASVVCPDRSAAEAALAAWRAARGAPAKRDPTPTATTLAGDPARARKPDGDAFYRVEHFPLPKAADLLVGDMDWLPNGDLALCTWPGEVWIVRLAQGPANEAAYQRFARGLHEPLGLKVIGGQIHVLQKCELTRLSDTDGNGEADLFECINADWAFTGNYDHFTFGPALDAQGNFHVAFCGNRGRWEMPWVGWSARISRDGAKLDGFCAGLRVPNGLATYGPDRDLFATDNEGNWIGACKLNHLQRGKFYGYPSGAPAARSEYGRAKNFQPPAVWFPRKLSASASGIAVISDERFGPFQGQLLVGEFQDGSVLRVALEKVNGEWQGAVWPFLKGFGGAVNRLSLGPDGKLYVGGCKRAWATPAPQEDALDRVVFTGEAPFEVKEVHARSDGLELVFTQPVDAATAGDVENFAAAQFTYKFHQTYGSPEIDHDGKEKSSTPLNVVRAAVSADRLRVHLQLENCRAGFVTMVRAASVKSAAGRALWHDTFYYTLNQLPAR